MSDRPDTARDTDAERWLDLDVKLAFQERLIRELAELRQAMPPPLPLGPINEPPPHY
jgi:hypothetical protein